LSSTTRHPTRSCRCAQCAGPRRAGSRVG
jgi:hypothetical protein